MRNLKIKTSKETLTRTQIEAAKDALTHAQINPRTSASLNVKNSILAANQRYEGGKNVFKDDHGWYDEKIGWDRNYPEGVRLKNDEVVFNRKENLSKMQMNALTALGCRLTADKIILLEKNKTAVEKILKK